MYQSEDFFRNFAFSKKWLSPKRLKLPTLILNCDKALVKTKKRPLESSSGL